MLAFDNVSIYLNSPGGYKDIIMLAFDKVSIRILQKGTRKPFLCIFINISWPLCLITRVLTHGRAPNVMFYIFLMITEVGRSLLYLLPILPSVEKIIFKSFLLLSFMSFLYF